MNRAQALVVFATLGVAALFTAESASAACTLTSSIAVSFAAYDVFTASDDDGTGAFTISCTTNTSAMISLSAGGAGSFSPRSMAGGGGVLNYNLYSDGSRTSVWGDGTGGSAAVSRTFGAGAPVTFTVYARIFRNQGRVVAGVYSDSVMVTVIP